MGSYAESLLTPDEHALTRERQHWTALLISFWVALFWGAFLILLLIGIFLPEDVFGYDLFSAGTWLGDGYVLITLIVLAAALITFGIRYWKWRTQEFLVTNRRLVLAWGILSKSASDSSLEKINDAQLRITVLGRILDYGHLTVLTAAPLVGADMLRRLNHAKAFKKVMMTAKHELQMGEGGDGEGYGPAKRPGVESSRLSATPAPVDDEERSGSTASGAIDVSGGDDPFKADTPEEVAAVLAKLTQLREEGHLSAAEYEAKKQELLDRL